jgi:hypothetical protein
MAYQVLRMGLRRRSGKPIISVSGGKIKNMTIFLETYELMKDKLPQKKDFTAIQFLVDEEQPNKFVIQPALNPQADNVVTFKKHKDASITFGCTKLLDYLAYRDRKMRLVGRWIEGQGPGALEFDIRKPQ